MRRISMTGGLKPSVWPQSSFTLFFAAASTIASASCMLSAIGFSETACLPALATSTTCGLWKLLGVATHTASTSGSAQSASALS